MSFRSYTRRKTPNRSKFNKINNLPQIFNNALSKLDLDSENFFLEKFLIVFIA